MKQRKRYFSSTQNNNNNSGGNNNSINGKKSNNNLEKDLQQVLRAPKDKSCSPLLLSWKQVPEELREPGILTGYRLSYQPWSYYFKSLFWIHNETGNIWTHLLSQIFLFTMTSNFSHNVDFFTDQASHGVLIGAIGSSICLLLSSAAHLFRSRSPAADFVFFSLDYFGIGVILYVQGVMLYHTSGNELFYRTVGPTFLQLLTICGVFGMTGMMLARIILTTATVAGQLVILASFGASSLMGQMPIYFRVYSCTMFNDDFSCQNISYPIAQNLSIVLQGIVYALRLPEKALPGKFDIWGHAHQLFHVIVSISIHLGVYISYLDLISLPRDVLDLAEPNAFSIWCNFLFYLITSVAVFSIFLTCKFYNSKISHKNGINMKS